MSEPLVLNVTPGVLASGFCPDTYQAMLVGFSAVQTVTFPASFTGIYVSPTAPSDTTLAWLKLDSLGRPEYIYAFASGAWLSPHYDFPGKIILWDQALPDFTTFDGGDANPISVQSGPFWEEVTELRGRFPLGVGTLQPSTTAVAVTDTGGADEHEVTLTTAELPAHTHTVPMRDPDAPGSGAFYPKWEEALPDTSDKSEETLSTGDGDAFTIPTISPYYTVYFLRRTIRQWRVG